MNKNTNIIIRIDEQTKENVTRIAKENGFKLTDIITALLKDVEKRNRIPIYLNPFLPKRNTYKKISIGIIKKNLEEIIEKNGKGLIKKAYIFGSVARGDDDYQSDVDIRLVPSGDGLTMFDIANMKEELSISLNKDVDMLCLDVEDMDPDFYENIKKDEICIYER